MRVILFGATGMVGQGVLRECLLDPDIDGVLTIGRSVTGEKDRKLDEIALPDMTDYSGIESRLTGFDACFFCLGVTSAGMSEEAYRRIIYDVALAAARTLVRLNAEMTFIYVSGEGTDSSEKGSAMWARVKGKAENDLRALPFRAAYMFRPGLIQPLHGIQSKTKLYRVLYSAMAPVFPLLNRLFPNHITTTERVGRAMIAVAKRGFEKPVLTNRDINEAARAAV